MCWRDDNFVNALAVDRRGRVVSASSGKTIKIWSVALGACMKSVSEAHSHWVCALAVGHSGEIISGSADNHIIIWNI